MSRRPTGGTTTVSSASGAVAKELLYGDAKPAKKHARGRPKKDSKATERITLYLTAEEKSRIQGEAEARGVSMAAFLRMAINNFCNSK